MVRTPFGFSLERSVVELSRDGRRFASVGRLQGASDDADMLTVTPSRTGAARYVCVRHEFSGHILSEISVW